MIEPCGMGVCRTAARCGVGRSLQAEAEERGAFMLPARQSGMLGFRNSYGRVLPIRASVRRSGASDPRAVADNIKNSPIRPFDGKTALEMIEAGRTGGVAAYLGHCPLAGLVELFYRSQDHSRRFGAGCVAVSNATMLPMVVGFCRRAGPGRPRSWPCCPVPVQQAPRLGEEPQKMPWAVLSISPSSKRAPLSKTARAWGEIGCSPGRSGAGLLIHS